jgi:hypothetical protein
MPNPTSYKIYTGDGTTTKFALTGIDGWINDGFIEVYLNETLLTSGYTLIEESGVDKVEFTTAPATGVSVTLKRNTPNTIATFKSDVVDFNDGSVLTAAALDRAVEALVHISQENDDANANALNLNTSQTAWDAENKKITNVSPGTASGDAVTFGQYNVATIYGGSVVNPQVWIITGNSGTTYSLNPAPLNTDSGMFIVENGGNLVDPAAYTISSTQIVFTTGRSGTIHVRNFGVARNIATGSATIEANSITTAMLQDGSVTEPKIANGAVTNSKIANTSIVATSKLTASGKNKLLATGAAVTIPQPIITLDYTDYTKTLLEAADAAAAGDTLGLEDMAYKKTVSSGDINPLAVTSTAIADFAVNGNKLGASAVTETKIADGAVTATKIPDASIAPVKLTANGPSWDANGTVVGTNPGTSTTGATVQVRLNRAGSVEAKSTSETNLWTGYNSSGTATTTIKAVGTPSVATDLTTKAYVDAALGTNWAPNIVVANATGTTWGSFSQVQLTYDLASAPVNRLTLINYVKNNGTASSGVNFTRLSNTSGAGISYSILYSRCNWYGYGGAGAANLVSPSNIEFGRHPVSYSGYSPPPDSSLTIGLSIGPGGFYYFKNWEGGSGWGAGLPVDQPNGLSGYGIEWYAWIIRNT